MIYINDDKIYNYDKECISIVTDFDKTLTSANSESTIGVFSKFLPNEYVIAKTKINEMEEKIWLNNAISQEDTKKLLREIWKKKLTLLSNYLKNEKIIQEIVESGLFIFREEAIDTLNYLQKKYDVVINSSGVGNLVVELLKYNGCTLNNLKVFSNFYNFDELSFDFINGIFPSNKINNEYLKTIANKNLILLGDTLEDLSMVSDKNKIISVGFLDEQYEQYLELFNKSFSIVATDNESYRNPIKILKL